MEISSPAAFRPTSVTFASSTDKYIEGKINNERQHSGFRQVRLAVYEAAVVVAVDGFSPRYPPRQLPRYSQRLQTLLDSQHLKHHTQVLGRRDKNEGRCASAKLRVPRTKDVGTFGSPLPVFFFHQPTFGRGKYCIDTPCGTHVATSILLLLSAAWFMVCVLFVGFLGTWIIRYSSRRTLLAPSTSILLSIPRFSVQFHSYHVLSEGSSDEVSAP